MTKKIDDDKLLKLIEEGKNQKEAAAILGVSEPAVSKRLKRLCPPPDTPHFDSLTKKEQKYVLERVKGSNQTQSALKAFECSSMESAKVIGSQLSKKTEIDMSIAELMNHCGLDKPQRIRRLKDIINSKDLNIAHKGLDTSFRLDGSYAPQKHAIATFDYQTIAEELDAQVEQSIEDRKKKVENWKKEGKSDAEIIEAYIKGD
jgi:phage terminase small subunit